ncbi:Uncharacterised protein [Mycobacterium tuberculosis]|nr:Uncharacterised protein [Mycobacterium tuberculosis]
MSLIVGGVWSTRHGIDLLRKVIPDDQVAGVLGGNAIELLSPVAGGARFGPTAGTGSGLGRPPAPRPVSRWRSGRPCRRAPVPVR